MKPATRFKTVDGLRGFAALAVVFYHFNLAISRSNAEWTIAPIRWLSTHGHLGVDVFFVISGFVIAYSIRNGGYSFGYLGRFVLRRSIRLDPPYWLTIAMELVLIRASLAAYPDLGTPWPSVEQLVAHLFYAQNLLGYGDIIPIFWTLCYEVQFYLFLVLLFWAYRGCQSLVGSRGLNGLAGIVLAALFVASLVERFSTIDLAISGLFLERWYQFALGFAVWLYFAAHIRWSTLVITWIPVVVLAVTPWAGLEQLVGVAASAFLACAVRYHKLGTWLSNDVVQFLGKISYSVYLIHLVVGWRFISLMQRLSDTVAQPLVANLVFAAGIGVTLLASALMWWVVERPSMSFSKRVTLPTRPAPHPEATA